MKSVSEPRKREMIPNVLLRRAREEKGWTQRNLADALNVEEQTVRAWESGKRKYPHINYRPLLCDVLEKTGEELGIIPPNELERGNDEIQDQSVQKENAVSAHVRETAVVPQKNEDVMALSSPQHNPVIPLRVKEFVLPELPASPTPAKQHAPWHTLLRRSDENRRRMLNRLRARWVTGALERQNNETVITLGLWERPDAVASPWMSDTEKPDACVLPVGTTIVDVYDQASQELLILGEPGAGKSTLLLELNRELIDRSAQDESYPFPVIFQLSSWEPGEKLAAWLVDELHTKYQIPRKLAQQWVEQDAITVLLDGLDEVLDTERTACIEAINTYRQDHGFVPVVVCSRSIEYLSQSKHLILNTAVVLQSLTTGQIDMYMAAKGESCIAMRAALQQDTLLREMVSTPLMLHILSEAYEGLSLEDLLAIKDIEQRRHRVFTQYVQRVFQRRRTNAYSLEETTRWLQWLAQEMMKQNKTEFYLEDLQHDALATFPKKHKLYINSLVWILFGWIEIVANALYGCIHGDNDPTKPGLFFWVGGGLGNRILEWMAPGLGGIYQGAASLGLICAFLFVCIVVLAPQKNIPQPSLATLLRGLKRVAPLSFFMFLVTSASAFLMFFFIHGDMEDALSKGLSDGFFCALLLGFMFILISTYVRPQRKQILTSSEPSWVVKPSLRDRLINSLVASVLGSSAFITLYAAQGETLLMCLEYGVIDFTFLFIFCFAVFGFRNGFSILHPTGLRIETIETVTWSWKSIGQSFLDSLQKSLPNSIFFSLVALVILSVMASIFYGWEYAIRYGCITSINLGLILYLTEVFIRLFKSGWASDVLEERSQLKPNQGIHLSARHAGVAALVFGVLGGVGSMIAYGLSLGLFAGLDGWLTISIGFGFIFSIFFSVIFFLSYGGTAVIEHYLLRWFLWQCGAAPLQYVPFLDYASTHLILRKVGGGYMFYHRLLLEFFASESLPEFKDSER